MAIDPNSPLGLVAYYSSLLIYQYAQQVKAPATIAAICAPVIMPQVSTQLISLSGVPASGSFVLNYKGTNTSSLAWNDAAGTIQSALRAISGLGSVTVSGTLAGQSLTVTFTGVSAPAELLTVPTHSLETAGSVAVLLTVTETDETLPLSVQDGFNLIGSNLAVGTQLDILGKYAGVSRSGNGPSGPITLDDGDFLTLIRFAIVQNTSGSSLATIENNLNFFFPSSFLLVDHKNMNLSYILSSALGSRNLFILLAQDDLIPKPMAVGVSIIVVPTIRNLFGFSTYGGLNTFVKPMNSYTDYHTDWIWVSYADSFSV